MEFIQTIVVPITPLLQTLIWVLFIVGLLIAFRKDIALLLREIQECIQRSGAVELGPIKLLERKVDQVRLDVDIIRAFILSMGDNMYANLEKMASDHFGPYVLEEQSGLWRELYQLRDMGYIHVESIRALPRRGEDLSRYVSITPVGREFVRIRETLHRTNPPTSP